MWQYIGRTQAGNEVDQNCRFRGTICMADAITLSIVPLLIVRMTRMSAKVSTPKSGNYFSAVSAPASNDMTHNSVVPTLFLARQCCPGSTVCYIFDSLCKPFNAICQPEFLCVYAERWLANKSSQKLTSRRFNMQTTSSSPRPSILSAN